jgi:hypothetical protein
MGSSKLGSDWHIRSNRQQLAGEKEEKEEKEDEAGKEAGGEDSGARLLAGMPPGVKEP